MDHLSVNRNSPSPTSSLDSMGSSNSLTGVYVYRSRSFNFKRKTKQQQQPHQHHQHTSSTGEKNIRDEINLQHQSSDIDFEEPPYLTNQIKNTRPRCNTDPSKFKNPRSGVLDKLVKHTINMKASPIAIAVRSPSPVTENTQNQYSYDFEDESSISSEDVNQLEEEIENTSSETILNDSNDSKMDLVSESEIIQPSEDLSVETESFTIIVLDSAPNNEEESNLNSQDIIEIKQMDVCDKIESEDNNEVTKEVEESIIPDIVKEASIIVNENAIVEGDTGDVNLINKIKSNQSENTEPIIKEQIKIIKPKKQMNPKVMQYFATTQQSKNLSKNEDISSFSDSNIDVPSSKKSSTKLTLPSSSQIKAGVKKSYSCIGKFNSGNSTQDNNDFYYKADDNKKLEQKQKKYHQNDDLSANDSNSDSQSSSASSSSPKLLRDKTTHMILRPKSTPPISSNINPIITSENVDKKPSSSSSNGGCGSGAPIIKRESFIRQSFNRLFRKNSTNSNSNNLSCSSSSNSSNSSCNSEKVNNTNSSGVEKFINSVMGDDGNDSGNNNITGGKKDKYKNIQYKSSVLNDHFDEILNNIKNDCNDNDDDYVDNNNDMILIKHSFLRDNDKNKSGIKILIERVHSESDLPSSIENENKSMKKHILGMRKNNSFNTHTKRSTNNVNTGIRSTTDSPMAPLQGQSETNGQSIINLSTLNKNHNHYQSSNNLNQQQQQHNSSNSNIYNNNNSSNNNLNTSNSNLNNGTSLKTDSKFQRQLSSSPIASSSESKQQSGTTTTSSSSTGSGQQQLQSSQNYQQQQQTAQERPARSISPHPLKSQSTSSVLSVVNDTKSNTSVTTSKNDIPEKEKKRKELSSSRKKKFHRHFQQVSKDERVLNYFSCALVSDILLQGHLYITENYFAFYSNVFGFVTKLLIPTSSVVKISKEKTAKIIPNAVGVATIDERHVFGSFMSREAAYRLMCSVCPPLEATENIIISPKVPDAEICEEYSVEDDSSCSISGNESPAILKAGDSGGNCGNTTTASSDASHTLRHRAITTSTIIGVNDTITDNDLLNSDIGGENKIQLILGAGTPIKVLKPNQSLPIITTATSTSIGFPLTPEKSISSSSSSVSSFKNLKQKLISLIHFKFPTEVHVVYIGIFLAIMLTLFSLFLMFRILDIEAKASYKTIDLSNKWSSSDDDNNDNIYAEALKWQKELQVKSTEEAQNILSNNLELIARVRKSLKALSMLINDRHPTSSSSSSSSFSTSYDTRNDGSILMEHDNDRSS